jgi:putative DNA primase/helicase
MRVQPKLPFDQVNETALGQYPDILFRWFPNGTLVDGRREFAIGDLSGTPGGKDGGSVKVKISTGKWAEMNGKEPAGHDPISLYAWAFCGGDRVTACKELGASLGIPGCNPRGGAEVVPFVPRNPPRKAEEVDWRPMVPPPDGVRDPNAELRKWDHVFVYCDRDRNRLRYVVRDDAKGGQDKKIRPLTYGYLKDKYHADGETGWHLKGPNDPKGIYGLEKLDGRPVLLQEGEKKTDDVQKLLPGHACLSLTFGTGGQNHNDLTPLGGMAVICSPDHDGGGKDTMRGVAARLRELGATVMLLDHTGQPDKWDLGNAVTGEMPDGTRKDPWTAKQLAEYLKARAVPDLDEPDGDVDADVDLGEPSDDDAEWKEDPATWGGELDGIIPLGFNNNIYHYLPKKGGQVVSLTPNGHSELQMRAMASDEYWYGLKQFEKPKGGFDWKGAAGFFMRSCQTLPIYSPDRLRGIGAWIDGERCVLHRGEHLVVDGHVHSGLRLPGKQSFVYERKASLTKTIAPPISTADAHKLGEIIKSMRWEKPIYGTLMSGWIAVAAICGALKWRPAIWVTGGSGAGKTTLDTNIVSPILEGICERMASTSTEAGIRQILGNNALPIIFDEAEAEGWTDKQRIQHVLDLVRQSTSEGGAAIVKGTQSQTGAIRYTMRSCFMFLSVNVTINRQADESRITVLSLENPPQGDLEAQAHYDRLIEQIAALVTAEYCAGFVARAVMLMPVIRDNAETFKRAVAAKLGSARVGDQVGTLCAGAYSLHSSNRITLAEAIDWVDRQDWEEATSADAVTDEQRLMDKLLSRTITVQSIATGTVSRTVGELLKAAAGHDDMPAGPAEDALKRCGIIPQAPTKTQDGGMWVANRHPALADYLKDTPWSSPTSWRRALKRYPGAKSSVAQLYFAGVYSRAIFVPVRLPGVGLEGM